MSIIDRALNRYARLLARYPLVILIGLVVITGAVATGASRVDVVEQNTEDFLPDEVPAIDAFNTINAEFSDTEATTYTLLIETDPSYADSNEIRDVREPDFLRYIVTLENDLSALPRVSRVSGPGRLFSTVPPTIRSVQTTMDAAGEVRWSQHISRDFSAVRLQVEAAGISADEETTLSDTIRSTVEAHPQPSGVMISYSGQTYIDEAFQDQSNQTMAVTTGVAFFGVLVVVILLFRSIFDGLTVLLTLVFGIAAGYGVFGYLGLNMSPATSGAISIGIGIAIDFGIQPVARYREERNEVGTQEAIRRTFGGIIRPMTLGVIAALMGFASLSIGKITFLSSLGILLSLTTFLAYIAAFTVIPAVLITHDKYLANRVPTPSDLSDMVNNVL